MKIVLPWPPKELSPNSTAKLRLKLRAKKGIGDDIKDVYSEAKATGYDVKIMRQIVRLRKLPAHDRQEMEAILATYMNALGMQSRFDF